MGRLDLKLRRRTFFIASFCHSKNFWIKVYHFYKKSLKIILRHGPKIYGYMFWCFACASFIVLGLAKLALDVIFPI